MILVDTSVWIDHFRRDNETLSSLLEQEQVLTHPFVIGELACGAWPNRSEVLALLQVLPKSSIAEHAEVLEFVERHRLYGQGIGWVDMHLLGSARLSAAALWTFDGPLLKAATTLELAF